jgi:hypothetical protein
VSDCCGLRYCYPVSSRVNSVINDDEECFRPTGLFRESRPVVLVAWNVFLLYPASLQLCNYIFAICSSPNQQRETSHTTPMCSASDVGHQCDTSTSSDSTLRGTILRIGAESRCIGDRFGIVTPGNLYSLVKSDEGNGQGTPPFVAASADGNPSEVHK